MTAPLRQKTISPNKWSYCQHCTNKKKKIISKCLECEDYFCIVCKLEHSKNKRTRCHATYAVSDKDWREIENTVTCSDHDNEDFDMFCTTCDTLICPVCMDLDHSDHRYTTIRQAARAKIHNMHETYIPKIRSKFEFLQKEKKKYEDVSDKIIKVMDTRSRIMKAALSNIVDRMKNEQKSRDGQNIKAYTGKIVTAYDEMIKKESMLAACNGDSDWNNIVILKKGKRPPLQNIDHVTSNESENVPEIPEINENAIDSVLINGLLSMFGKQKFR